MCIFLYKIQVSICNVLEFFYNFHCFLFRSIIHDVCVCQCIFVETYCIKRMKFSDVTEIFSRRDFINPGLQTGE
jgi:hypothetical protein